jgi:luciferase family oxidoreductase group 1
MSVKLSILDLAPIGAGQTTSDSFRASVALAQQAERYGYTRVWYAEHHNMSMIASSATSVLIAHVGAHTETIRLGSGGIMLPNHPPLVIAEQFGTLAAMYPDRIDLGLGRAPGSDQNTARALRLTGARAQSFPEDIRELQGYLSGRSVIPGVEAIPGRDSQVPLYILGSSRFGAQLAAAFGLPYAFASHFSPRALDEAIATYRAEFQPSEQLDRPYVMAAVNVLATDTAEAAERQRLAIRRQRAVLLYGARAGGDPREVSDQYADYLLNAGMAAHVDEMMTYTAQGPGSEVRTYLEGFIERTGADELVIAHGAPSTEARLHSVALLAEAMEPALSR